MWPWATLIGLLACAGLRGGWPWLEPRDDQFSRRPSRGSSQMQTPRSPAAKSPIKVAQGHKWASQEEKHLAVRMRNMADDLAEAITQQDEMHNLSASARMRAGYSTSAR